MMPGSPSCLFRRMTIAAVAGIFLCGCRAVPSPLPQSAAANQTAALVKQRLMIRFKAAETSCTGKDIVTLADATAQNLEYIRPMSGEACVVEHAAVDAAALALGLQRIREHPAVDLADIDRVVTIRQY